jgi:Ca2+-binding RTX toxin-like protein
LIGSRAEDLSDLGQMSRDAQLSWRESAEHGPDRSVHACAMRLVTPVTIAFLGVAAAPAAASSVSTGISGGGCIKAYCEPVVHTIRFVAAAGERNDVRFSPDGSGFRVRDEGAELQPGSGCTRIDAREARCEGASGGALLNVVAELGDGDDRLVAASVPLLAYGREGADTLTAEGAAAVTFYGGEGPDRLTGGDGADRLFGDADADELAGGGGADTLGGDAFDDGSPNVPPGSERPADDRIDGGDGADRVTYSRKELVTVDLRAGVAGQSGERDVLTSIEGATGGAEDDVFLGDVGPNAFVGGSGADVIYGGPGDDTLESYGDARLYGDEGDDFLRPYNSARLSCGPGTDRVQALTALPLGADCELYVSQGGFGMTETETRPVELTARRAIIRVHCVPQPYTDRCSQPVTVQTVAKLQRVRVCHGRAKKRVCKIRLRRVTLGSRDSGSIPAGQSVDVVVPFNRAGRALRERRPSARLRVLVTSGGIGFGWVLGTQPA